MKSFCAAVAAALVASTASAGNASPSAVQADPSTSTEQRDPPRVSVAAGESGPRLRFGVGGTLSVGVGIGPQASAVELNPGLLIDVGLQINGALAVYLRGEGGTVLLMNHADAYAVAEWTPVDWLSLGTGMGVDAIQGSVDLGGNTWIGASIPLVVGFNIGGRAGDDVPRRVFRIGLEFAAGVQPSDGSFGYHGGLGFGWTLM